MTRSISGGCRFGAVRYTLATDRFPRAYACRCHYCQTWSGSAFSQQAVAPEDALTVTGDGANYDGHTEDRISRQPSCPVRSATRASTTPTPRGRAWSSCARSRWMKATSEAMAAALAG